MVFDLLAVGDLFWLNHQSICIVNSSPQSLPCPCWGRRAGRQSANAPGSLTSCHLAAATGPLLPALSPQFDGDRSERSFRPAPTRDDSPVRHGFSSGCGPIYETAAHSHPLLLTILALDDSSTDGRLNLLYACVLACLCEVARISIVFFSPVVLQ